MTTRRYNSPTRAAASLETRHRLVAVGAELLRGEKGPHLSMEAVARAAGVTRLTVYKQFGSRRALLEAVFDDRAAAGGLTRLYEAMAIEDPREAVIQVIDIFCAFWASDAALGRIHDAGAADDELRQALLERNERRRQLFDALLRRTPSVADERRRDMVDLLYTLTSLPTWRSLKTGREDAAVRDLIQAAAAMLLGPFPEKSRLVAKMP